MTSSLFIYLSCGTPKEVHTYNFMFSYKLVHLKPVISNQLDTVHVLFNSTNFLILDYPANNGAQEKRPLIESNNIE